METTGTTAAEMRYSVQFGTGASPLRTALQSQLTTLGSALTPDDVVARAQALSCAGCHKLSSGAALGGGLNWPASLGFTHVTERQTEVVGGETRYVLSDALRLQFLPARKAIFSGVRTFSTTPVRLENYSYIPVPFITETVVSL